jgi:hypothetical protein
VAKSIFICSKAVRRMDDDELQKRNWTGPVARPVLSSIAAPKAISQDEEQSR